MTTEVLGSEYSTEKIKYLIFMIAIYMLYFFLYIGMKNDPLYLGEADKLWFFIWFGLVAGVLPFVVDLLINNNKDLPLDTVSYDNNSPLDILNRFWVQVGVSVGLAVLLVLRINLTGEAFVKAPSFALTIPFISSLGISQAVVSGFISGITAGVVESIVFFGFILPTIYAVCKRMNLDDIMASFISVLLTTIIFTSFHLWVYGYQTAALASVFAFGIINGVAVIIFRSLVPNIIIHFANNFFVYVFVLSAYMFQVVI